MLKMQQIRTLNWDHEKISALDMIKDRYSIGMNNLNFVINSLELKTINKRFHDEPKRIVNDMIRKCHGSMGMYAGSSAGCLYYEEGVYEHRDTSVEHTVPVANLIELYIPNGNYSNIGKIHSFGFLLFFPVCLLSKSSNAKLNNFAKSNNSLRYPFRRYFGAGIDGAIFDHT